MISRDEFYEKFPHVLNIPEKPQCAHCLKVFTFTIQELEVADDDTGPFHKEEWLMMHESHLEKCPLFKRNGLDYKVTTMVTAHRSTP